ncbi:MAG: hypothetical protein LLF94_05085 [Chlamydiales bacterium]|nr:hypothetical protein [Chlamydiales bacterium]
MISFDVPVVIESHVADNRYIVEKSFKPDKFLQESKATLDKKVLRTFINKGGTFIHLDPKKFEGKKKKKPKRFQLKKGDIVYPGCAAGFNRSQTLYAVLTRYQDAITLFSPHASKMGFDPYNNAANWHINKVDEQESDEFILWSGHAKVPRFGFLHFAHLQQEQEPSEDVLHEIREYYNTHYFGPTSVPEGQDGHRRVYITFGTNVHVILHRLSQNNTSLKNVILVGIASDDRIHRPIKKGVLPKSKEAYAEFEKMLHSLLDFSKLNEH